MSITAPARPDRIEQPPTPPGPTRAPRSSRSLRSVLLPPGWPLAWLFVAYPLWWILGLSQAVVPVLSAVMLVSVLRRRSILVPRSFGFWLLFLVWCVGGLFLLQVDAPGAIPGPSNGRYGVWALRMMWYLSATCILLYVGNMRRELPLARIARILSWMFVTIVIGGLAGALLPKVDFPSVVELLLPQHIANIPFVQGMVHPNLAQVQRVLGYQEARPSAPFSYTNTWGLAFSCFLPFFVVSWFRRDAGWRRFAAPVILVASVTPVVQSLNRGLWGALIGMAVFVAIRYAVMGRVRMFVGLLLAFGALGVGIVASPLSETISQRWAHQHSNEGRTDLGTLTVTSTLQGSPIVGFGTTRNVQGNFNSIAGGQTAECPKCSPPSLGTQGQAWLLIFTTGLGGLLTYAAFFGLTFLRGLRLRSPYATTGLAVLLAHAITSVVYNVNGPGLLAIMIGVAFLWREGMADTPVIQPAVGGRPRLVSPTVGGYVTLVRRNVAILVAGVLLGLGAGYAALAHHGIPVTSTMSVTLSAEPAFVANREALTIDSDAQYIDSQTVREAVEKATDRVVQPGQLTVTATPNSRVLQVHYTARNRARSMAGARAAAEAFLDAREARLTAERSAVVDALQDQVDTARRTVIQSQAILDQLQAQQSSTTREVRYLNSSIDRQIADLGRLSGKLERAQNQAITPGSVVRGPVVKQDSGLVEIVGVSAALVGLVLALLVALVRDRRSPRLRSRRSVERETGLPVVSALRADEVSPERIRPVAQAAASRGARAGLTAGPTPPARTASTTIDDAVSHPDNALGQLVRDRDGVPGVVLVADRRTTARGLTALAERAEDAGSRVLGVVHVRGRARRRPQTAESSAGVQDPGLR